MPKKLRLDPETLAVESFDAVPEPTAERGTVRGRLGSTFDQFLCECTYGGIDNGTCDVSCNGTCLAGQQTCDGHDTCGRFSDPYCPTGPGAYGC